MFVTMPRRPQRPRHASQRVDVAAVGLDVGFALRGHVVDGHRVVVLVAGHDGLGRDAVVGLRVAAVAPVPEGKVVDGCEGSEGGVGEVAAGLGLIFHASSGLARMPVRPKEAVLTATGTAGGRAAA